MMLSYESKIFKIELKTRTIYNIVNNKIASKLLFNSNPRLIFYKKIKIHFFKLRNLNRSSIWNFKNPIE